MKEMTKEEMMQVPLLHFAQPNYKEHDNVFNSAMAFYGLVLDYRKTEDDDVRDRILAHIRLFTQSGREPQFDVHAFHSYVPTCAGLALVKHTPALYEVLSKDVKNRVRIIMRAFALLGMLYTDSDNWLMYNLGMFHPVSKEQAPNLIVPTMFTVLGARYFAGSEDAFKELVFKGKDTFDYDEFIGELRDCGFRRALRSFAHGTAQSEIEGIEFATVKDLMETRTTAKQFYGITTSKIPEYIGAGKGIHLPYSIKDVIDSSADGAAYRVWYRIDGEEEYFSDTEKIYKHCAADRNPAYLVRYIFNGGECKNEVEVAKYANGIHHLGKEPVLNRNGEALTAHTQASDKVNPSLGKSGMIAEFDISARSDMTYCYLDFAMAAVIVSVCREFGFVDDGEVWGRALTLFHNGSEDLFYKDEVGYVGYNAWNQDYAEVVKKDCAHPFYRIAKAIYDEYEGEK